MGTTPELSALLSTLLAMLIQQGQPYSSLRGT